MSTITVTELRSSGNHKRGRSNSSSTLVEFDDHGSKVNKKPRIRYSFSEMLRFSNTTTTTITSSVGKENRIPQIHELFVNKSRGRRIGSTESNPIPRSGFLEPTKRWLLDAENERIPKPVSLKDDHYLLSESTTHRHAIVSNVLNNDITGQERSKSNPVAEGEKGVLTETKTLRVEMLKKRFSHLIVKAQQEELLSRSENIDPVKMMKEKEILEKKLKEAQTAAEAELKKELQRKREAARMALLELERTVEVDDNIKTMKEFAMLLGYPQHCAACVSNEVGWHGLSFSNTSRTSDWRKR